MFRFKIESTAKRRSLLALATSANFSTFTSPWPSARNLQPTTAGSPSCEQLDKRLRTKICDSAKLQSQVIPLELHKHQHLPKDASTFKIKDFSSKLSEMNEITWTNIYTIHLCNYVQTPFIPPGGAVWISRAAALAATRRRFRTMGLAPLTRRAGPAVDRSVVSSENQLYSLTSQHVDTREV